MATNHNSENCQRYQARDSPPRIHAHGKVLILKNGGRLDRWNEQSKLRQQCKTHLMCTFENRKQTRYQKKKRALSSGSLRLRSTEIDFGCDALCRIGTLSHTAFLNLAVDIGFAASFLSLRRSATRVSGFDVSSKGCVPPCDQVQ